MKTFGYIATFLGGAVAGAAIGLLLAPEKGTDTRSKIADVVDNFCKKHDIAQPQRCRRSRRRHQRGCRHRHGLRSCQHSRLVIDATAVITRRALRK